VIQDVRICRRVQVRSCVGLSFRRNPSLIALQKLEQRDTWRIICNGELQGAKPSIIDRDRTKMHPLSRALSIAEAMLANRVLELAVHAVIRTISSFHGKFPDACKYDLLSNYL